VLEAVNAVVHNREFMDRLGIYLTKNTFTLTGFASFLTPFLYPGAVGLLHRLRARNGPYQYGLDADYDFEAALQGIATLASGLPSLSPSFFSWGTTQNGFCGGVAPATVPQPILDHLHGQHGCYVPYFYRADTTYFYILTAVRDTSTMHTGLTFAWYVPGGAYVLLTSSTDTNPSIVTNANPATAVYNWPNHNIDFGEDSMQTPYGYGIEMAPETDPTELNYARNHVGPAGIMSLVTTSAKTARASAHYSAEVIVEPTERALGALWVDIPAPLDVSVTQPYAPITSAEPIFMIYPEAFDSHGWTQRACYNSSGVVVDTWTTLATANTGAMIQTAVRMQISDVRPANPRSQRNDKAWPPPTPVPTPGDLPPPDPPAPAYPTDPPPAPGASEAVPNGSRRVPPSAYENPASWSLPPPTGRQVVRR